MKSKIFLLAAVCLFSVFAAKAQTSFQIVQEKTHAVLLEKSAEISLETINSNKSFSGKIALELLDTSGKIRAAVSKNAKIKTGAAAQKISLPLGDLMQTAEDEIAWYRLSVKIYGADDSLLTKSVVSLSEIIRDIFELRVAAAEKIFAGMNYRARARAVHPFTGAPIKGVKIAGEITLDLETEKDDESELKITAKGKTDADGFAVLDFKIPEKIDIEEGDEIKITGSKYGYVRQISEDLEAESDRFSAYLNTDKPLYQPGQMLNVRGILLRTSAAVNTIVSDAELDFSVKDGDDSLLYKSTVKTSGFGIAAISWTIPENAKLGEYKIEVKNADGEIVGYESIKVTRYDLPNFTVSAKADKNFYLANDKTAVVTVSADYLFGKPVAKGKAKIARENEREWNYRTQKWSIDEGETYEGEADESGKFTAQIDLSDDHAELESNGWRRYEDLHFAAYFTDPTTNRTEQKRFDIRLTKEAIHIYFVGQTYDQNPNFPLVYFVSTFYADGSPVAADVEITGKFDDETTEKSIARIKTNSFGAGKLEFAAPKNADIEKDLKLKIAARDGKNQTGTLDENIDFGNDDQLKIKTEKTIFRDGETIKAEIFSTEKSGLVYVDLVKDWSVIYSGFAELKDNRAELKIPFQPQFKGELTIAAYSEIYEAENDRLDLIKTSRGIIFPAPTNLNVEAKFSQSVYRPNEEGRINFSVFSPEKMPVESALGIVVFDKAIEERARTDSEFGEYRGMFGGFRSLLGYDKSFGGLTLRDLNEIDMRRPISDDLQTAAEVLLYDNYYYPEIHRSDDFLQARSVFSPYFDAQFAPIEAALKKAYAKDYSQPADDASLKKILRENKIEFENLLDPWRMNYRAEFSVEKAQNIADIKSSGADKKFGTKDDFTVLKMGFEYFMPLGKTIDRAISEYHRKTGKFVRDYAVLRAELKNFDVDLDAMKDRWNRAYRVEFSVSERKLKIVFHSAGEDGDFTDVEYYTDDFNVWTNETDYFTETENKIADILSESIKEKTEFPQSETEFEKLLKNKNFDLDSVRDAYDQKIYLTVNKYARFADKAKIETTAKFGEKPSQKTKIEPVTQQIITLKIRSKGADLKDGTEDDFDLAAFSGVVTEQTKNDARPKVNNQIVPTIGAFGAVRGTIVDPTGAVIPGVKVTARNVETEAEFSADTNDEGIFIIENLPAGKYEISAEGSGFSRSVLTDVPVRSKLITEADMTLNAAGATMTVDVMSSAEGVTIIETTSSMIGEGRGYGSGNGMGSGGGGGREEEKDVSENRLENSTPRLREYFPETLVWNPELVTGKNGRAELKFKTADNITTWKMYAIASDASGKIGVADAEAKSFQPFFVDLEPPKFLTDGDEIFLPVQIRNYTDKKQKTDVSMAKSDWFDFLNAERQQIEVAANATENAVFGFKANAVIKNGKQKVTAIAAKDSDAIEKPVTVKPNGQEIVKTESKLFSNGADFQINFPSNALDKTTSAELKIYPNLFSHVAESVEGLLQRPYGCGEQTISSTYPNLMILKFVKNEDEKLNQTARKYLQKGYERLIGYQVSNGGFSYWGGKDEADIALTAYAIRFLSDADGVIEIDKSVIERAQKWLIAQQRDDGSFTKKYYYETAEDKNRTKIFTAYVARSLAMQKAKNKTVSEAAEAALEKSLGFLKTRTAEIDEPYALALFGLASFDAGNSAEAKTVAEKLETMAIAEKDSVYWNLETNTPFYGWGTPGRIETTALVLQLLIKTNDRNPKTEDLISKATMFLLKNKDRYGVWYSTQTTINVLDAFLASLSDDKNSVSRQKTIEISLNGTQVKSFAVTPEMIAPLTLDLKDKLNKSTNVLEIKSSENSSLMAQIVQSHYIDWRDADVSNRDANESRQIRLDYKCDGQTAAIMQEISCAVEAERIGFRGYGMLLAEIGIPPGADVSRESLEKALEDDSSLSRYDVLPDRIVFYMWSKPGGTKFNFKFRPRYAVSAQTPSSIIYDYYNDEAKGIVAPLKFEIK